MLPAEQTSSTPLTLVFTDMVGSSAAKRAASLGENTSARDEAYLSAIQTRHLHLVRDCVATHGGKEIMTIGDSFFLTFDEARAALLCSAEIQMRLKSQPIMTETGPVKLRIGIHCGTPKFFENSWHGTDVDTAARAESAGSPDQIILTDAARLQLGPLPGIPLHRLGTFALKGVGDVVLWDVDYDQHGPRQPQLVSLETQRRRHRNQLLRRGAYVLAAAVLVLAAFLFYRHRQANALAPRDAIILADFDNKSGDPVFDTMLTQAVSIQLQQSPVLNLVSQQHLQQSMQYLGKNADDPVTPALAREIGEREGIKAYLSGSIVKLGSSYVITLSAQNTHTGDNIASEQAEAADKDHVLEAVGKVSTAMRSRLGESLASVQKLETPLVQATTPSLEAFRAYALGDIDHQKGLEIPQAEGHYKEAVELDPNFAMAWARLGVVYTNAGQNTKAAQDFTRAFELSKNVSERERLYIEGHFYYTVQGDLPKTIETLERATQAYPLLVDNYTNLSVAQLNNGQLEESLATIQKALSVDPSDAVSGEDLIVLNIALDRLDDAAAAAANMQRLHNDGGTGVLQALYQLDFLQGNAIGMERTLSRAQGRPDEMQVTQVVALVDEFAGRYAAAAQTWKEAEHQAETQKAPDSQALFLLYQVSGRALAGSCDLAPQTIRQALALDKSKATLERAAYAAALCDDKADALPLMATLAKQYPDDTTVQKMVLPQSRAAIDLAAHQPSAALQELDGSEVYDFASPAAYLRGLAYLDQHEGAGAVDAFQRATKYKGISLISFVQDYGQAILGLARAYTMTGNKPAAKKAYESLFTTWKTADPDLPQLLAAKKEYATLQ